MEGRIKITCDLQPTGDIEKDKIIIPRIINRTISLHQQNVAQMQRLFNYYYNKTDIVAKEKVQQSAINNKIAIDYAQLAVTTINGYAFSNGLTFSSRQVDNVEAMKAFTDSLDDDSYGRKLKQLLLNYGICGLAYKYITSGDKADNEDNIWYKTSTDLDPRKTYCVYDNTLEHNKTCAVSISERTEYNDDYTIGRKIKVYQVWTKYGLWEFVAGGNNGTGYENRQFEVDGVVYDSYPNTSGEIPIIEYRSLDGTGYFELAIDLINAINALASSRVDDVQQAVDYVIVLRDIDTDSDGALERIKDCLKDGLLSFRSIDGAKVQPNISVLDTKLNQSEVQTLQQYLQDTLEEILNIPNRNNKSSGGDSGSAVESRNGFRSLENKAGLVTDDIIAGENDALKVIFGLCANITRCPFNTMRPRDIEIKDNRNKYENLTNASTAYSTLRSAGMNDRTALEVTKLVGDAITVSKLNEQEKLKNIELEATMSQNSDGGSESDEQNKNGSNAESAKE